MSCPHFNLFIFPPFQSIAKCKHTPTNSTSSHNTSGHLFHMHPPYKTKKLFNSDTISTLINPNMLKSSIIKIVQLVVVTNKKMTLKLVLKRHSTVEWVNKEQSIPVNVLCKSNQLNHIWVVERCQMLNLRLSTQKILLV